MNQFRLPFEPPLVSLSRTDVALLTILASIALSSQDAADVVGLDLEVARGHLRRLARAGLVELPVAGWRTTAKGKESLELLAK